MSSIIRIFSIGVLLTIQVAASAEDAVNWAPNLETAKRAAASRQQLVLVHFYADNCPPCRVLEAKVFPDPKFASSVERNFVPVKINASQSPAVAKEFGVDRWPQDVVITPSGQVVYRMISPQDIERYTGVLNQVASKLNPNANSSPVAQVANNAPAPSVPQAGSRFTSTAAPSRNASLAPPQEANQGSRFSGPVSQQAASPAIGSAPGQSVGASRFSSTAAGSAPANPAVAPPTQSQQHAAQPQGSRFSSPGPSIEPSAPRTASAPQAEMKAPEVAQAPKAEKPEFALDGYCPVTLIDGMKWQKGDKRWGAVHMGQVYLFSTQSEQQRFLADPNRYSPVMSGIDPVAYLRQGKVVPGDRRFGLTYHGTLYLFSSEESLQAFWGDPQRFSSMVQQAMSAQNMRR